MEVTLKEKHRFNTYGITPEQYDKLLMEAGNTCQICSAGDRRLAIDHCHETGHIRGILCIQCNSGIGMLQDDIDVLLSAIQYLRASESNSCKLNQV